MNEEYSIAEKVFQESGDHVLQEMVLLGQQGESNEEMRRFLEASVEKVINDLDREALVSGASLLTEIERKEIHKRFSQTLGYGQLEKWLEIPNAENVYIFGSKKVMVSYADGSKEIYPPSVANDDQLIELIRFLASTKSRTSRRFDNVSPILDLRLPTGHRLFAIMGVSDEPCVVIRYHQMEKIDLEALVGLGTISPELKEFIYHSVIPPRPANILIGGGTSTGKTTTLRALLSEVPQEEVLVTIEDTLEIHLKDAGLHTNCFELETRIANIEGAGEITMYDLAKAALRMAPDRVIVGEVRGGEIMQLLNAMGQGNDGSVGTIHANSSEAVISRILTYSQRSVDAATPDFVLRQVGQTLDLILFLQLVPGPKRVISSVREVLGYKDGEVVTSEIYRMDDNYQVNYLRMPHPEGTLHSKLSASGFDFSILGKPAEDGKYNSKIKELFEVA